MKQATFAAARVTVLGLDESANPKGATTAVYEQLEKHS